MIACADAFARRCPDVPPSRGAEWAPRLFWAAPAPLAAALAADLAPAAVAAAAYVSEGRWVVMCPDCSGAQLAAREDPRFLCVECANVGLGGLWRPVVWPSTAEITEIEVELERRPLTRNRNWIPGETVADLAEQYAAAETPLDPDQPVELVGEPIDPEEV